jgi:GTP-binding protein
MEPITTEKIRNIAVIAHVDHGKTTLVDFLLKQTQTFRENEAEMQQTTILDSNPLERERGITILAKNTAIFYKDYKINIIDTPGHADFSGEVERILNMADGALLIVDAQEGPMPQTKFVLKKALELGLKIIVIINKVDKQLADIPKTLELTNDLFLELATDTEQLNFPVFYAIGREGKAAAELSHVNDTATLTPILDSVLAEIPHPQTEPGSFHMLVTALDYDTHKGKHIIGKIARGTAEVGKPVVILQKDDGKKQAKIEHMYVTYGLKKEEVSQAVAGEIVEVTGLAEAEIGDTISDPADPVALPRISIEEPTIKIALGANTSPFAGREGKFSNSRQILERLEKELETNVAMKLENLGDKFMVSGRGELHLSILIETMRREGYEFQVGKPEVILKTIDGVQMEPVEDLIIDVTDEFVGQVTEEIGRRKGQMVNMVSDGRGNTRLEYTIPSKALIGIRSLLLTKTKGTAIINTLFKEYQAVSQGFSKLRNGVLIASESGVALAYGLANAQERGMTFIDANVPVYEGMIIGLNSKDDDIEINVTKEKKQSNMRSKGEGVSLALTPPLKMSLEQCLDFLESDELLEVTPDNLRLRKKHLSRLERVRNSR